jgi:hypothetical protein
MGRRKKVVAEVAKVAEPKIRKVAVLTVFSRHECLELLIDSMRNQRSSWDDVTLVVNVDVASDGSHSVAVMETLKGIDFVNHEIRVNKTNKGIKHNTQDVMAYAYDELHADTVLYLEDDFILSPDVLDMWNWFLKQDTSNVGVMSLFNKWGGGDKQLVHRSRAMTGWGFFSTAMSWNLYLKPAWINPDYMWDSSVARYIRTFAGIYNLFPDLSRTSNSGKNGVHVNEQVFNEIMKDHKYHTGTAKVTYKLTDEYKPDPAIHKD